MSKQEDQEVNLKSPSGAESPQTRPELEMDSDNEETPAVAHDVQAKTEDAPPPKPPRPLSPQAQAEKTLHEAFPSIDSTVVKAVLVASGGRIEPAFNALLGMSDPDAVEPTPPPQPPRPQNTPQSQLEADELYARQLAESYGGGGGYAPPYGGGGAQYGQQGHRPGYDQQRYRQNQVAEENRSFIDDDLPIIKENLKKGFLDTQRTVNGWITNLKKKIDGEEEEDYTNMEYGGAAPYHNRRTRQSGDMNRYDADPQVLDDDFAGIQLNDDGGAARHSTRPLANPDLFKPTPSIPKTLPDDRKVTFQNEKTGGDLYDSSPKIAPQDSSLSNKQSKWQPLSNVEPSPIGEAENDPFSLGDSEDEKETKDRVGGKEIKTEDAERLKKAAAEAMADNIVEHAQKPEPAETSGTKDKVAEDLATKS